MTQLHELLERATDRLEPSPHLAATALSAARRSRMRRRAVVAPIAAAAVLATILLVSTSDDDRSAVVPPSPADDRATEAPPIPASAVQDAWDPRDVANLPRRNVLLPLDLIPGPSVDIAGSGARILAMVDDGQAMWVVDDGERWQRYDYPEKPLAVGDAALSTDGTHLFVTGRTGLWSRGTDGGGWRRVDYPAGFNARADFIDLLPEAGSVTNLGQDYRTWRVDFDARTAEGQPFDLFDIARTPDHDYVSFGVSQDSVHRTVVEHDGEASRTTPADALDYLQAPVASNNWIAATRTASSFDEPRRGTDLDGLLVVARRDLHTLAYLPVVDDGGWYGEGAGLRAVAWLPDNTLLFSVVPVATGGYETGTSYLVAWDPETGDLRLASQLPASYDLSVAVDVMCAPGCVATD